MQIRSNNFHGALQIFYKHKTNKHNDEKMSKFKLNDMKKNQNCLK